MASMLGVLMKNERAQKETNDRVLLQTNKSENPFFFFWEDDIKKRPELNEG